MTVRNTLQHPSTDLGTLCSCNKINKWAKYKPVSNRFTYNRPVDWWKGWENNCGITSITHRDMLSMINSIKAGVDQHPYIPPSGGPTSPYRLGDFAGYNTDSIAPISAGNVEGVFYLDMGQLGIHAITRQESEDELSIADIFQSTLINMYYGALVQKVNDPSRFIWITTPDKVTDASASLGVSIPMSYLNSDTSYYVFQFLSSIKQLTPSVVDTGGEFIAIPGRQQQVVQIKSSMQYIALLGLRLENEVVRGSIYITNSGPQTVYRRVMLHIRYRTSQPGDTFLVGESILELPDITVPGYGEISVPFNSASGALPDFNKKGGKVWLYMDGILKAQNTLLEET